MTFNSQFVSPEYKVSFHYITALSFFFSFFFLLLKFSFLQLAWFFTISKTLFLFLCIVLSFLFFRCFFFYFSFLIFHILVLFFYFISFIFSLLSSTNICSISNILVLFLLKFNFNFHIFTLRLVSQPVDWWQKALVIAAVLVLYLLKCLANVKYFYSDPPLLPFLR